MKHICYKLFLLFIILTTFSCDSDPIMYGPAVLIEVKTYNEYVDHKMTHGYLYTFRGQYSNLTKTIFLESIEPLMYPGDTLKIIHQ